MADNGRKLTHDEIASDVDVSAKEMRNGERRYRLSHPVTGISTSITSTLGVRRGGWQNAHRHLTTMREVYAIHEGWVVLAELGEDGGITYQRYQEGQTFAVGPTKNAHNLYVSARTIFATVKFGSEAGRTDWDPAPELDERLAQYTEPDVVWALGE